MNTTLPFTALDLRDFLKALGWVQIEEALKDGLFVLEHPQFLPQQLVFGVDDRFVDYDETLQRVVRQLGQIYQWPESLALRKVVEAPDDLLQSRVVGEKIDGQTLPFLFAARVIESEKKLLQAAANAVEHPQSHYSRSAFSDSQNLLEAARFRHTEEGSFIFKVSCDVYALDPKRRLQLTEQEDPFVRRTMLNASRGLQNLVASIQSDTQQHLVETLRKQTTPFISSNFCDAVAGFGDQDLKNTVEFSVAWSPLLPPPSDAPKGIIKVIPEYFPLIAEIGDALKPSKSEQTRRYVGTVEDLKGRFNNKGQREGVVVLWLFQEDGKRVKVRVTLDADQYDAAHAVHKDNTTVVRVSGIIKPGRQPRDFSMESFEIINA